MNFDINSRELGHFDVAVCGGGIAGASAAISASREGAKVILIEAAGSLGGTLTEGFMPILLDSQNKGGIVRELYAFLDEHGMTCPRHGDRTDGQGNRIPGIMVDTEGCKYFFDKTCRESGVTVLFHSRLSAIDISDGRINGALISTECGNYTLTADLFIDASGNGNLADMAGCKWECGDPHEGRISPASMGVCAVGMPENYNGTDTKEDKDAYGAMLSANGIHPSSTQGSCQKLPSLKTWSLGVNFQYDVTPDDIFALTNATLDGRREVFEIVKKHKAIPGYESLYTAFTSSHIGIREGRRIYGEYRITDEDILEGRRFDDGICLVTFGVDVHKLKNDDTTDCKRGYRAIPYNIPYRALVAKGVDNLLLAGRCISGDFYPHASYRVMGNMAATGEAAGFAAAKCAKDSTLPRDFDGKRARDFMCAKGYEV